MDRIARLVVTALILFWVIALTRTCGLIGAPQATADATLTPEVTATLLPTHTPRPTPTATPVMEIHVVRAGDSLWSISQQYGVTVDDLIMANDLIDPSNLRVGDELRIPPKK